MGRLLLFAGDELSSSETPDDTFQISLVERLLDVPGLPLEHDRDMAHSVTATVCADLVDHSQHARLRADDYRSLVKLAEGVMAYDFESKRLFHGVYLPPPALNSEWITHLRTWLVRIKEDEAKATHRGRPENTWEPHLFASGLGLYSALYGRKPTITGGADQKPGPSMRFMIDLIDLGRTLCRHYTLDTAPWRAREHATLKKQIKSTLDFEKSRRPHQAKVPDPYRPKSYVVYRDIYLARLRGQSPFSTRARDDFA